MSDNGKGWICNILKAVYMAVLIVLLCMMASRTCRGDTVISRPAGDGVNIYTVRVDDDGYIVSESSTAALALRKYAEQLPPMPGECYLGDFKYIFLTPGDWAAVTNRIARLESIAADRWRNEHKTVAGRQAWHGAATNRVVSADGLSVTWLYPDGYAYTETEARTNAVRRVRPPAAKIPRPDAPAPVRRVVLPPRLAAKREAEKSRPKVREVNAVFGPGGKVLKVEGDK